STAAIQKANLKLGQTPVSLKGNINAKSTPAQMDMTVQASNASIAEAARLAAAFGAAFNATSNVSGNLNLNLHGQGAVTRPALNGQVMARNLSISGGELREPVQVDAVELSLSPDAIRSNEFTAKTGHTSATAQFTLSDYVSDAPVMERVWITSMFQSVRRRRTVICWPTTSARHRCSSPSPQTTSTWPNGKNFLDRLKEK